jgi:hypothetical protein
MENTQLQHHGTKGMKWGVRRYQNPDGTLTNAGKKRYERDQRENAGKKKGNKVGQADPDRWVKEDMQRSKNLTDSTNQLTRNLRDANSNAMRRQQKNTTKMDLSNMTDKEMRDKINRALLERQYEQTFNPPTVSKGRDYTDRILEVAGGALAVTGSALGIALAIKELRG